MKGVLGVHVHMYSYLQMSFALTLADYRKRYKKNKKDIDKTPCASDLEMELLSTLTEQLLCSVNDHPIVFKRASHTPSKSWLKKFI